MFKEWNKAFDKPPVSNTIDRDKKLGGLDAWLN